MGLGLGLGVHRPSYTGGFTIDGLSGLVAWYPFNTGQVVDGDALESWADASGNNHTLTNTTATNKRPTYESGRVNFGDVGQSYMNITNGAVPNSVAYSVFLVVEFSLISDNNFNALLNATNVNSTLDTLMWGEMRGTTSQLWQVITEGSGVADNSLLSTTTNGAIENDKKTIIQFVYGGGDGAGDKSMVISTDPNGGSLTQVVSATKANSGNHNMEFGAVSVDHSNFYVKGYIDEIAIFNRKLTVDECALVRADIKARNSMT
tara:strand:- start:1037 stop:1822 length:786 start_codon:yes stop_codon:yes gene_type:complete